jgi:hypothetical protein
MNDMETNNVTQWVIIGAAVLVLVAGGAWLVMRDTSPEPIVEENTPAPTSTPTLESTTSVPKGTVMETGDGESITVEAQRAGSSVEISSMELTRASWVAVRDDMSILGASWFASSVTSGTVKLQRATESGKTYRVVIYVDDGDKKFDFKADKLLTVDGQPIGVSFLAN